MNKREYYKLMNIVFKYYSILFSSASLISAAFVTMFPSSWQSCVAFLVVLAIMHFGSFDNINRSIAITSVFISTFAWMITYILTFELMRYTMPVIYAFSSFILWLVAILANHYKIRFSCIKSYVIAGLCTFIIFPPLLIMSGHNLYQGIAVIIVTFYETALLITHSNYLILYASYEDPHQIFRKVNGR